MHTRAESEKSNRVASGWIFDLLLHALSACAPPPTPPDSWPAGPSRTGKPRQVACWLPRPSKQLALIPAHLPQHKTAEDSLPRRRLTYRIRKPHGEQSSLIQIRFIDCLQPLAARFVPYDLMRCWLPRPSKQLALISAHLPQHKSGGVFPPPPPQASRPAVCRNHIGSYRHSPKYALSTVCNRLQRGLCLTTSCAAGFPARQSSSPLSLHIFHNTKAAGYSLPRHRRLPALPFAETTLGAIVAHPNTLYRLSATDCIAVCALRPHALPASPPVKAARPYHCTSSATQKRRESLLPRRLVSSVQTLP